MVVESAKKVVRLFDWLHRKRRREVASLLRKHGVDVSLRDLLSLNVLELKNLKQNLEEFERNGFVLSDLNVSSFEQARSLLLDEGLTNRIIDRAKSLREAYGRDALEKLGFKGVSGLRRLAYLEEPDVFGRVSTQARKTMVRRVLRSLGGLKIGRRVYNSVEEALQAGESPKAVQDAISRSLMVYGILKTFRRRRMSEVLPDATLEFNGKRVKLDDPAALLEFLEKNWNNKEVITAFLNEVKRAGLSVEMAERLKSAGIEEIKSLEGRGKVQVSPGELYRLSRSGVDIRKLARAYLEAKELLEKGHVKAFQGEKIVLHNGAEVKVDLHELAHHIYRGGVSSEDLEKTLHPHEALHDAVKDALRSAKETVGVGVQFLDLDHERVGKSALTGLFLEQYGRNVLRKMEELIEKHKERLRSRSRVLSYMVSVAGLDPDGVAQRLKWAIRHMSAEELDRLAMLLDGLEECQGNCVKRRVGDLTKMLRRTLGYERDKGYRAFYERFGMYHTLGDPVSSGLANGLAEKFRELKKERAASTRHRLAAELLKELLKEHYGIKIKVAK